MKSLKKVLKSLKDLKSFESVPISRVYHRLNVSVWTDSCMSSGRETNYGKELFCGEGRQGSRVGGVKRTSTGSIHSVVGVFDR